MASSNGQIFGGMKGLFSSEKTILVFKLAELPLEIQASSSRHKVLMETLLADLYPLERRGGAAYQLADSELAIVWSKPVREEQWVTSLVDTFTQKIREGGAYYHNAFGFVPNLLAGTASGPFNGATLRRARPGKKERNPFLEIKKQKTRYPFLSEE